MGEEFIRKMAYVAVITDVFDIEGADRIVQYEIDNGWKVIDQKGKYQVNDVVVYCAIDSWVPSSVAPFLTKPDRFPRLYENIEGEKLRTIRLKGALSQGLILNLSILSEYTEAIVVGGDVSQFLNITKWEAPEEAIHADTKGGFPQFLYKSDQERIQNCYLSMSKEFETQTWTISEKVEGQSFTAYLKDDEFGVCSRNLNLKDSDNTFWNTARKYDLENKLRNLGRNLSIVGEQYGSNISGNIYGMREISLLVYDIFDIDAQVYLNPVERLTMIADLGLVSVPIFDTNASLQGKSLSDILAMADGKSVLGFTNTLREGLVFSANSDKRVSFKAISDKYLLLQKD